MADIFELTSEEGMRVKMTNIGAAVLAIYLPDKKGELDILLGTKRPEDRLLPGPMFGTTLGRVAGRIKDGSYEWKDSRVELSKNRGSYHCHGGVRGFDKRSFRVEEATGNRLVLSDVSPDGEEGYPGNLKVRLSFQVEGKRLITQQEAVSDRDTIVSMSNHMYFNLNGQGRDEVTNHWVRIRSDVMTQVDRDCFDTGAERSVEGTAFDFRSPRKIGEGILRTEEQLMRMGGYDHNFLLSKAAFCVPVAYAASTLTGHTLTLYTDMPAMQFYVADFTGKQIRGKDGKAYEGWAGFCMEPQYPPNAMNTPVHDKPVLRAGERYCHRSIFSFDEVKR